MIILLGSGWYLFKSIFNQRMDTVREEKIAVRPLKILPPTPPIIPFHK